MKRNVLLVLSALLIPMFSLSAKDPNIINKKSDFESIMGKSKLFDIAKAQYDTNPATQDGVNQYTLVLGAKKVKGEAVFTFLKEPSAKDYEYWAKSQNSNPEKKPAPSYQTVTLKVYKYADKTKSMEKEAKLELALVEPQTIAVYEKQQLTMNWSGDGGWGTKGYHLFSYNEKLTEN